MTAGSTPAYLVKHRKDMWKIRWVGIGLILAGLLFGVGLFIWDVYANSWPTVDGRVTNTSSTRSSDDDRTSYSTTIWYEYEVDGKSYSGSFSETVYTLSRPSLPPDGARVEVHYSPAAPFLSRMEASLNVTGLLMAVCCLIPFGMLWFGLSFLPAQKPEDIDRMMGIAPPDKKQ